MTTVGVKEVLITDQRSWQKWPDTDDTDFSKIIQERRGGNPYRFADEGVDLVVDTTTYPQYLPYVRAGVLELPQGMAPGMVDNTRRPAPAVVNQLVSDLLRLSGDHEILRWQHAYQCFPEVMERISGRFKVCILEFGDDCPGSSEIKTFPVAKYFDALVYRMLTWDYATGVRTAEKYQALGLPYCRMHIGGTSDQLQAWCKDTGFTVQQKAEDLRRGAVDIDLIFVGCRGDMNPERRAFLTELNHRAGETGHRSLLCGSGMRDGELLPRNDVNRNGYVVAPYYARSRFGVNFPISSFFNGRLFDLFETGVVQVLHDRHGELTEFGYRNGTHYIGFDGSIANFFQVLKAPREDGEFLSRMALAAKEHTDTVVAKNSYREAIRHCYGRYLQRLAPNEFQQ